MLTRDINFANINSDSKSHVSLAIPGVRNLCATSANSVANATSPIALIRAYSACPVQKDLSGSKSVRSSTSNRLLLTLLLSKLLYHDRRLDAFCLFWSLPWSCENTRFWWQISCKI